MKILLSVIALLLVGAGCSTTSTTTVDTTTPAADSQANTETSGNAGTDTTTESNTTTGVNVDVGVGVDVGSDSENIVEVTVTGRNMSFDPKEIKVKKGDTVRITFKNAQGFHDFVLDEFNVKTKQIGAGQEEVVEFVADKTGSFEYYCSVGSHRKMGMIGTLIVE